MHGGTGTQLDWTRLHTLSSSSSSCSVCSSPIEVSRVRLHATRGRPDLGGSKIENNEKSREGPTLRLVHNANDTQGNGGNDGNAGTGDGQQNGAGNGSSQPTLTS